MFLEFFLKIIIFIFCGFFIGLGFLYYFIGFKYIYKFIFWCNVIFKDLNSLLIGVVKGFLIEIL